jgi:hypothetical protein
MFPNRIHQLKYGMKLRRPPRMVSSILVQLEALGSAKFREISKEIPQILRQTHAMYKRVLFLFS